MDDEILQEFLVESVEALDALDVELVELENEPDSTALLSSIFRRVHTIKGTCGFLGFGTLESVSHVGENLLSKLRDGELSVTPEIATVLLEMNDALRDMLTIIEESGAEGPLQYEQLRSRLEALTEGRPLPDAPEPAEPAAPAAAAEAAAEPVAEAAEAPAEPARESAEEPVVEVADIAVALPEELQEFAAPVAAASPESNPAAGDEQAAESDSAEPSVDTGMTIGGIEIPQDVRVGDLLVAANKVARADIEAALARQEAGDPRHIGELLLESGKVTPNDIVEALQTQQVATAGAGKAESIRVDVGLLDNLMNLVGELVLARNQILQVNNQIMDQTLITTSQRLDLITTELQGGVMQTRMQPIENAWSKFPRVVRDLARQLGKRVELEMIGKETELDKTLLEAIRDPLTHLVRNSMDHGMETIEERASVGKSEVGTLTLRAFHEGGQVNIEVADDGRGLNFEAIRRKVVEKDLVSADRAAKMSHRELGDMIFAPGFSTAATVSNVSGRGVGMDVVKTNIEKIGGSLDMQSAPGEGTSIKIKIPLTLAIIPALTITSNGDRYAIPQVSLLELVRLGDQEAAKAVEWVDGTPIYRLRGRLLPLVFLNEKLADPAEAAVDADAEVSAADIAAADGSLNIVVLQGGEREFGLVVDEINDTAEIVVKPLGSVLKSLTLFSGATIMGDGHVALILDVLGIAHSAGLAVDARSSDAMSAIEAEARARAGDVETLLVFALQSEHRYAVNLSSVTRLEEFRPEDIERSGRHEVVQYRGGLLPLIHVDHFLEPNAAAYQSYEEDGAEQEEQLLQVVVHTEEDRHIGLVVGRILDIVDEQVDVRRAIDLDGLAGSVVVQGKVTDVVDVTALMRMAGLDDYAMA